MFEMSRIYLFVIKCATDVTYITYCVAYGPIFIQCFFLLTASMLIF